MVPLLFVSDRCNKNIGHLSLEDTPMKHAAITTMLLWSSAHTQTCEPPHCLKLTGIPLGVEYVTPDPERGFPLYLKKSSLHGSWPETATGLMVTAITASLSSRVTKND